MKILWKASWVPEPGVRTTTSIVPFWVDPGTWLQVRTPPPKTAWTPGWSIDCSGFASLVTMQTASRAILWKTRPPGSLGFGSREELPIVTRPAATSATPMSEPPWSSLKLTQ